MAKLKANSKITERDLSQFEPKILEIDQANLVLKKRASGLAAASAEISTERARKEMRESEKASGRRERGTERRIRTT